MKFYVALCLVGLVAGNPSMRNAAQCPDNQMVCPDYPDECFAKSYPVEGMPDCHADCPEQCSKNQQVCMGAVDSLTGCIGPDKCEAASYPSNLEGMPDCPVGCPVTCTEGEKLCPEIYDSNTGCYGPETCCEDTKCKNDEQLCPGDLTCQPMFYKSSRDDRPDCYRGCPILCAEDQQTCPGVHDPETGCLEPNTCEAVSYPSPMIGMPDCPAECPKDCAQQMCPGKLNPATGCMDQQFCVEGTPSTVPDMPDCPAMCPVTCDLLMEHCPGVLDESTGCEHLGFCMPPGAPCS